MNPLDASSPTPSRPRGLFSWRTLRRLLVALAVLATLVAIFYTEENVRGRRAWAKVRREMEAEGVTFEWSTLIPPPVADDQNIYTAPIMKQNFIGRGSNDLSGRLSEGKHWGWQSEKHVLFAEVTTGENSSGAAGEIVWQLDDPFSRARVYQLLDRVFGTNAIGCQGILLVARTNPVTPAHIVIQTREPLTAAQVETNLGSAGISVFQVTNAPGGNGFHVTVNPPLTASEYLAWSDRFEPDFAAIREALKRPYARFNCDYSLPHQIDIPNFVTSRDLEQTLAQRAQCHLMLGQSDKALEDLTLMHDLCRIFEAAPVGKPMTLVSSMINVAVEGLYADTVADALRFHAWNDAQLAAIEQQCVEVHLAPYLKESLREEQIFSFHVISTYSRAELVKLFEETGADATAIRFLKYGPEGWLYQNMVRFGPTYRQFQFSFDPDARTLSPHKAEESSRRITEIAKPDRPYTFIGVLAVPNFVKAIQRLGYNQTAVNEAAIACALERYRLAHGDYPETLAALTPQFIERLPHDMIGGGALKYHRGNDGKFVLYSIGWNERDDAGVPGKTISEGDWVWLQR